MHAIDDDDQDQSDHDDGRFDSRMDVHTTLTTLLTVPTFLVGSTDDTGTSALIQGWHERITSTSANNIDDAWMHQWAVFTYQCRVLEWERALWTTYAKAGIGRLRDNEDVTSSSCWPASIISMIRHSQRVTTVSDVEHIHVDDAACQRFVQRRLDELDEQRQRIEHESHALKTQLLPIDIDITVIDAYIHTFLVAHTSVLHARYIHRIRHIELDYDAHQLVVAWHQLRPNEQQVRFTHSNTLIVLTHFVRSSGCHCSTTPSRQSSLRESQTTNEPSQGKDRSQQAAHGTRLTRHARTLHISDAARRTRTPRLCRPATHTLATLQDGHVVFVHGHTRCQLRRMRTLIPSRNDTHVATTS
jgi:hypothetical protein